jgi:hypothetical protein
MSGTGAITGRIERSGAGTQIAYNPLCVRDSRIDLDSERVPNNGSANWSNSARECANMSN